MELAYPGVTVIMVVMRRASTSQTLLILAVAGIHVSLACKPKHQAYPHQQYHPHPYDLLYIPPRSCRINHHSNQQLHVNQGLTLTMESVKYVPQELLQMKQIFLKAALHVPQGHIKMK